MSKSFPVLGLAAILFAAGCASQAEFLNNHQSSATQAAVARAQFEMNCQQVTPVIISREVVPARPPRTLDEWDPTGRIHDRCHRLRQTRNVRRHLSGVRGWLLAAGPGRFHDWQ